MFDDFDGVSEGKMVRWCDPQNTEFYGSGPGPFRVVMVEEEEEVAPTCTCGGRGGGLLDDGHSPLCEIRAKKVVSSFVTVLMNGRHRSFDEALFEVVK
jgi:hypothetical protein